MLDTIREIALTEGYLLFGMGVMFVPMMVLGIWYHTNINKSEGGQQLMKKQNAWQRGRFFGRGLRGTGHDMATAGRMAKDIQSGRYGDHAQRMQSKVYVVIALWLVAVAIVFGILVWAVETSKTAG